jgi:hypothetical protein
MPEIKIRPPYRSTVADMASSLSGLALGIVAIIAGTTAANGQPFQLKCADGSGFADTFIIDAEGGEATLLAAVEFDEPVVGTVAVGTVSYHLHFPQTTERWETHVRISRYSGYAVWEHGTPPFFESNDGNVVRICIVRQSDWDHCSDRRFTKRELHRKSAGSLF